MRKLRLTDADRERLGAPEFLLFDASSFTNREAIDLQKLGYPTPTAFLGALRTEVVDGVPRMDYEAWTVLIWLLLKRAGIETDPSTLTYDVSGLVMVVDEPVEPKPAPSGKAPGRAPSTSSRKRNSTSSATSKPRSSRASSTS